MSILMEKEQILKNVTPIWKSEINRSFSDENNIKRFYYEFVFKNVKKFNILETMFINKSNITKYKNVFTKKFSDFDEIISFFKYFNFEVNGFLDDLNKKIIDYKNVQYNMSIEYEDDIGENEVDLKLLEDNDSKSVDALEQMLIGTFEYSKKSVEVAMKSNREIQNIKKVSNQTNDSLETFINKKRSNKTTLDIQNHLKDIEELIVNSHENKKVSMKEEKQKEMINSNTMIWVIFVVILLVIIFKL